ncbi:MAG: hypothetical protein HN337_05105 [Deltaproteobacteria bacterium]|nr:hypothetical protein [Deltaproteobacteria bacterium]
MKHSKIKTIMMVVVVAAAFVGCGGTQGEEEYNWSGGGEYECEMHTYSYCKLSSVDLDIYIDDFPLKITTLDYPFNTENITQLEGGVYDGNYGRHFKVTIGDVCKYLRDDPDYEGEVEGSFSYTEGSDDNAFQEVDEDALAYLDGNGGYTLELILGEEEVPEDLEEEEVEDDGVDGNEFGYVSDYVDHYEINMRYVTLDMHVELDEGEFEVCAYVND